MTACILGSKDGKHFGGCEIEAAITKFYVNTVDTLKMLKHCKVSPSTA